MYACGLRISEAATLEMAPSTAPICSFASSARATGAARTVAQPVLDGLREFWKTHRDPRWLFPNHSGASANPHVLRRSFQDAAHAAGIHAANYAHALRHNAECRIIPRYLASIA